MSLEDEKKIFLEEVFQRKKKDILEEIKSLKKQLDEKESSSIKAILTEQIEYGKKISENLNSFETLINKYLDCMLMRKNELTSLCNEIFSNIEDRFLDLEKESDLQLKQNIVSKFPKLRNELMKINEQFNLQMQLFELEITHSGEICNMMVFFGYYPFTVLDYDKATKVKNSILEVGGTIIDIMPGLTEIKTVLSISKVLVDVVSSFDIESLKKDFYETLDESLVKLEKQTDFFKKAVEVQNLTLNHLEQLLLIQTDCFNDLKQFCENTYLNFI